MIADKIVSEIKKLADPERAKQNGYFFKDYEYLGKKNLKDTFLGIRVPETRSVVKSFWKSYLAENYSKKGDVLVKDITSIIQELFNSEYHEERLAGAMLLRIIYEREVKLKKIRVQESLFKLYNKNVGWNKGINNWDLVDETARDIAGSYVSEVMNHKDRMVWLDKSIASSDLWVTRVAVVATWHEIKKGNEKMCFYVVERLFNHPHDLIHKACGWMLREVGRKCSREILSKFIHENIKVMPRTCLRYAIEHFNEGERKEFLRIK